MIFDDLISEETVMDRVDAYSIYSYYIGSELEVGRAYKSPLRIDDDVPSFALFEVKNLLLFKDHGLGITGNVFQFVKMLYGYDSMITTLSRINSDFGLELEGGVKVEKNGKKANILNGYKKVQPLKCIKVASKKTPTKEFKEFWNQYGIKKCTLDMYGVTQAAVVYYHYETEIKTVYPKSLCNAYPIYDKYKIYMPYAPKGERFRNNYPETYVEGFLQLQYKQDFCIITKSTKEVMFFRQHFDWDSVAGKSENTIIVRFMMLKLLKKFKYLFIWLDNDVAGQRAQNKYLEEYPFLIPVYYDVPQKDPTDRYKEEGDKQVVLNEIKTLMNKTKELHNGNIRPRFSN